MKIVVFTTLFFLSLNIYAQEYILKIDSTLKHQYTVETVSYFKNIEYSLSEEKHIVEYLIKFKNDSNYNCRMTVSNLFYSLALYSRNLSVRKESAFHNIDMYWISYHFNEHNLLPKEVYTEKTLNRIMEIINGMNDLEKKIRLNDEVELRIKYKTYQNKIELVKKNTNLSYSSCVDSIRKVIYHEIQYSYINELSKQICKLQFIKTIGWLYYFKSVPVFEDYLVKNTFNSEEYNETLRYVLARMGVKKIYDELLNQDYFDFVYLNTQEAYWLYIQKNYIFDDYKKCVSDDSDNKWPASNSAELTLFIMTRHILNLPSDYHVYLECSTNENTINEMEKRIKDAYIWLKENKGKYLLKDYLYIN